MTRAAYLPYAATDTRVAPGTAAATVARWCEDTLAAWSGDTAVTFPATLLVLRR
jgi:hypothetical protein